MHQILINEVVKKLLVRQTADFRARLREKFEYLENGLWDGGLRVKKVRGASDRTILEARLDRGRRILFTLGRSGAGGAAESLIYVWGVVDHDSLNHQIQTILPENVPFLNFTPYREEDHRDLELARLAEDCFCQEDITERISDDSRSQRWYPLAEPEWRRLGSYRDGPLELRLHLTPQQQEVLETSLPVLLSGTAGSGKTTLAVYYLLHPHFASGRKLFLTYNRFLRDFAENLYTGLAKERSEETPVSPPEFRTLKELCLEVSGGGKRFDPAREVDYVRFQRFCQSLAQPRRLDSALVWEEIRSIIKGALSQVSLGVVRRGIEQLKAGSLDEGLLRRLQQQFLAMVNLESSKPVAHLVQRYFGLELDDFPHRLERCLREHPDRLLKVLTESLSLMEKMQRHGLQHHLSLFEYEHLGRKRAPNFTHQRADIYDVYQRYQRWLEDSGHWDELDLSREALRVLMDRPSEEHRYDLVVCDEVQDLADVQQLLLFGLARSPSQLFLAGDTRQIINPSGFRWEETRRHFHRLNLPAPELRFLTLNFRSSGSIVELANTLLSFKEALLGSSASQPREDWKYRGRPPVVASGLSERQFLGSIRRAGAGRTILVRAEEERDRLRQILDTELVFTIKEAKGLEFQTAVLWKFAESPASRDVWNTILQESERAVHDAFIQHEINLLYVGITRAQDDLIVFDGPGPSAIWTHPAISAQVYLCADPAYIDQVWNVPSSPEAWREQGLYFHAREIFKAAMECFKNAGDLPRYHESAAAWCLREERWREAAAHLAELGQHARAAELLEQAGDWEGALELWRLSGDEARILACSVEVFERAGRHAEAAPLHLRLGRFDRAADNFAKARQYGPAAEIYLKKLKKLAEAAECYELAGLLKQAEACLKKAGDVQRQLRFYERTRQLDKLAETYERLGDFPAALRCLKGRKDVEWLRSEGEARWRKRQYAAALNRFTVAGDRPRMAECLFRLRRFAEAAELFAALGDFDRAGEAYLKAGLPEQACESFLRSPAEAGQGFPGAARALRMVDDVEWRQKQALDRLKKGDFARAVIFCATIDATMEGCCWAALDQREKALGAWSRVRSWDSLIHLARFCQRERLVEIAGDFVSHLPPEAQLGYPVARAEALQDLVHLMDKYFATPRSEEQVVNWSTRLLRQDFTCHWIDHWERLLAGIGRYNYLLRYTWVLLPTRWHNPVHPDRRSKLIPRLMSEGRWEQAAYHLIQSNRFEELAPLAGKIVLTETNSLLLLGTSRQDECLAMLKNTDYVQAAAEILVAQKQYRLAAECFEDCKELVRAAPLYAKTKEFGEAARVYASLGKHNEAGDILLKAGRAEEALAMFHRAVRPRKRSVAKALEKLGRIDEALRVWRSVGDKKAAERCFKMDGQRRLF